MTPSAQTSFSTPSILDPISRAAISRAFRRAEAGPRERKRGRRTGAARFCAQWRRRPTPMRDCPLPSLARRSSWLPRTLPTALTSALISPSHKKKKKKMARSAYPGLFRDRKGTCGTRNLHPASTRSNPSQVNRLKPWPGARIFAATTRRSLRCRAGDPVVSPELPRPTVWLAARLASLGRTLGK